MPVTINGNGLIGGLADIKVPDGTASAPTISNIDDLNTGIFFPAEDTIAFSEGGVERLRIDSSGNVGIGTSSPGTILHIAKDGAQTQIIEAAAGAATLQLRRESGTVASPTVVSSGDIIGQLTFVAYDGSAVRTAARINGEVDGTPGASDMPGRLTFSTTPDGSTALTERMRIDSSGRVGIGTNSPSVALDVQSGDVRVKRAASNTGAIVFGNNFDVQIYGDSDSDLLLIYTALTERFRIDGNGLITGTGTSLGAWTAYTPTLSGTNWALGNGTVTGYYCRIGKMIHGAIYLAFGSTSTAGAAQLKLTVPVTPASGARVLTSVVYYDASLAKFYMGGVNVSSTDFEMRALSGAELIALVDGSPFTWATSDQIRLGFTYEAS